MIHSKPENQTWRATPYAGIEMCVLRRNAEGGGAIMLKVAKGARFPLHDHPGGEEVYVVHGRAVVGGVTLTTGDYLWTPPDGTHDLRAEDDTMIFVTSPNSIQLLD